MTLPETAPVALVTGASRGIGRAIALTLAELGYRLVLVARSPQALTEVADTVCSRFNPPAPPLTLGVDAADAAAVAKLMDNLWQQVSRIDVLVNNAGIYLNGTSTVSHADYERLLAVNLGGVLSFTRAVVPRMRAQKSGTIFNLASYLGKRGSPVAGLYAASKHAVVGLSDSLARELAGTGIKVTVLCPSFVATDMTATMEFPEDKMILPEDLGHTVAYLLRLSPNAYVRQVMIECAALIDRR